MSKIQTPSSQEQLLSAVEACRVALETSPARDSGHRRTLIRRELGRALYQLGRDGLDAEGTRRQIGLARMEEAARVFGEVAKAFSPLTRERAVVDGCLSQTYLALTHLRSDEQKWAAIQAAKQTRDAVEDYHRSVGGRVNDFVWNDVDRYLATAPDLNALATGPRPVRQPGWFGRRAVRSSLPSGKFRKADPS